MWVEWQPNTREAGMGMQEGGRRRGDNERGVEARHLLRRKGCGRKGRGGGRAEEEEGCEKVLYAALRGMTLTSVANVAYP